MRTRTVTSCLAVLTALALLAPAPVAAQRLGSDLVGERAAASYQPPLTAKAPDITAPAGILMTSDGRVLWARDADARRPMASTTKIMTALVALKRAKLSAEMTVPKAAEAVAQSPVNLTAGETLTVRELLDAMLVESANDAAFTLAERIGGSQTGFADLMNAEAGALGLKDTHFTNPHGLDEPGHYTSARDLAVLARAAMADPTFRQIVAQRQVVIPGPNGERRVFKSTDDLLGSYPGMIGIKTGFTDDAGYCLVSAAERGGTPLYGVILGTRSESARFSQTRKLLDWGFAHYRQVRVIEPVASVGTIPVSDWLDRDIVAKVAEGTSTVLFDLGGAIRRRYELQPSLNAPVRAGDVVGSVSAFQGTRRLATVPIVAAADVPAPRGWDRLRIALIRGWRSMFGPKETRTARILAGQ